MAESSPNESLEDSLGGGIDEGWGQEERRKSYTWLFLALGIIS